jgi:hypothetical protein
MAHFAELDENNIVKQVIVVNNDLLLDEEGNEQEILGVNFCQELLGGIWIQTSYNAATNGFRKNYAGIGYTYNEALDAFIPSKPYDSWTLDEETCQWQSLISYPTDGLIYEWNENTLSWEEIESYIDELINPWGDENTP